MENKEIVGIDYEKEYLRLKDVEKENKELKETLINLTKLFVNSNDALEKTIKDIDRNLRLIARKWGKDKMKKMPIVIDNNYISINGYTSYLIAKNNKISHIEVEVK